MKIRLQNIHINILPKFCSNFIKDRLNLFGYINKIDPEASWKICISPFGSRKRKLTSSHNVSIGAVYHDAKFPLYTLNERTMDKGKPVEVNLPGIIIKNTIDLLNKRDDRKWVTQD